MGEPDVINGKDMPTSWTINVSDIRTIKVSNITLAASEREILEFFSFSGDIQFIEIQRESETTNCAYVNFRDSQRADTAILLTSAIVAGLPVLITRAENYQLPPHAPSLTSEQQSTTTGSAMSKAEDMASTMLANGFILGKDALNKAIAFDKKHHLKLTASATVASIDQKLGLSEKLRTGTTKMEEMNELYQVSEMTKLAGSAILSNRYVSSGTSWVTNAFSAVSKAAEGVSTKTKEKVEKADEEKREMLHDHLHEVPVIHVNLPDGTKLV